MLPEAKIMGLAFKEIHLERKLRTNNKGQMTMQGRI